MTVRQAQNLKSVFSILAVLFVAVLLLPVKSEAVDPQNIVTYQGRLLDTNGIPVSDASATILFEFYDDDLAGSCLWTNSSSTCATSTARSVTLANGLFSENLGDNTLGIDYAPISNSVFGSYDTVYLQITINGEPLTPRKLLTAAPYAVNAQTLDGLNSLDFLQASNNLSDLDDAATARTNLGLGSLSILSSVDISDNTNLAAGTNITLDGDTLNVDDAFLLNNGDTATGIFDFTGAVLSGGTPFTFEGATGNDFETFFTITDPTADNTITFKNASGTVAFTSDIPTVPTGAGLWEVGANGTYEDDAAVIVGSDAAFTHASGAAGDLRIADELEVIGNSYFDGSVSAIGQISLGDNGDTFAVNSLEFDVSASTGSITIDDDGNAGQISIEGTVLDINTLYFTGGGEITAGANQNIVVTPAGTGDMVIATDSDSQFMLSNNLDSLIDITTGENERLVISPNGTGDTFFPLDDDSNVVFDLTGNTGDLSFVNLGYNSDAGTTLDAGASVAGMAIDLSSNLIMDGGGNILTGLLMVIANGGASTTYGIDINGSPDVDINLSNGEEIRNSTDDNIGFYGLGGTNNTGIIFDLDGATTATPTIYASATDAIAINDSLLIGVDGNTAESISDDGFSISGGNDLYITDSLGVNGQTFFNAAINIPDAIQMIFGNGDDVTLNWTDGTQDFVINNTSVTGSTIFKLGTATTATDFQIIDSSSGQLFSLNGTGVANFSGSTSSLAIDPETSSGNVLEINTTLTEGMLMKADFSGATVLSNDLRGLNLDLNNNVSYPANISGIDTTGIRLVMPAVAETGGGAASLNGISLTSGALSSTSGEIYWTGSNITIPAITQTGGTIEANGYKITTGSITTGGTEYGVRVDSSGVSAGSLYGINIDNLDTPAAGSETALNIGSGWDIGAVIQSGLSFGTQTTLSADDTTPSIKGSSNFVSGNVNPTTVTAFDDGQTGQIIFIKIADSNTTFDCSSLNCGTTNISAGISDIFVWLKALGGSSSWDLISFMDDSDNHNTGDGFDLAEYFQSNDSLLAGEVVTIDPTTSAYVSRSPGETYDNMIVGVVSTDPGEILGDSSLPNSYPIALAGRVPTDVTNENGVVFAGDPLTTSSTPGYAMKATKAGKIVGYALEDFTGTTGQVLSFVQAEWSGNDSIGTDGISTTISDTLRMSSLDTADAGTPGVASQIFALRGSGWNGTAAEALDMKIQTEANNSSDYRLSIKNTTDTEVAYITNTGTLNLAGDMIITGNIYPSDRGATQTSKYIYYDGSAGPGGDMMRTNAAGWSTGSYDFAEMFPSDESLEAGDVVVFSGSNEKIGKTSTTYHPQIAGIISTRPGFLAGENQAGHFPVALAGRVPTKVNLEGGNITVGDPLTTSSTPGYAIKANSPGMIVGYALEPYTGGNKNKITVFVNSIYYNGNNTTSLPGISNTASLLSTDRSSNFTTLNMEGGLYMGGNDILNIRRLVGMASRWIIEEDGTFKTEGTIKTIITSYQNEKVETSAVTSSGGVFITLVGTTELNSGTAIVKFEEIDPKFNDVISTTAPVRVVVTPSGPVSLYVSQKDNNGFTVSQIGGSDSGITVDWMVSAYRKDFEPTEEEETEEVDEGAEEVEVDTEDEVEITEVEPVETTDSNLTDETIDETPETETSIEETITEEELTEETAQPEVAPIIEEELEVVPEEPAPSESPTQISDPTVETEGDQVEPVSSDVVSTDSSAQTGG